MVDKLKETEFLTGLLEFSFKALFCGRFRTVKSYLTVSQSSVMLRAGFPYVQNQWSVAT